MTLRTALFGLVLMILLAPHAGAGERSLEVGATAYNSVAGQTDDHPWLAAWGDPLENGMKVIAVSRDLLQLGLERGTRVRIDGLAGEYVVLDKMNKRWERKIDVYMGDDVDAALGFGRRVVTIRWEVATETAVGSGPPDPARSQAAAGALVPESVVTEAEPR